PPRVGVARGFVFSSRRRHTRFSRDWSSDVCSSDLRPLTRASAWAASPSPVRCRSSRLTKLATSAVCAIGSGMYSPCTVTASSWVVTAASSARAGCASAAPTARNRPWRRGRDRVFGDVMAWTLAAPGRLDVLVQTDAAARGRHVLLAGVSPGSVEADGPAGPPGAVGVLGRTDVVHVLEEAVLGIDRDRGHRRLVGAVDVVRAQGGGGEHGAGLVGGVDVGGGGGVLVALVAAEVVGQQLDGGAGAGDVEAHVSLLLVGRGRRGHQHAVPHVRLGALVHLDQRIQARVGGVDGEVGDLRG